MQGLYLVTDRGLCGDKMEEVIVKAVRGGARYVQLREKNVSTRFFVEEARRLKCLLKPFSAPLIINDRVDVAAGCRCRRGSPGSGGYALRPGKKNNGTESHHRPFR